MHVFSFHAAEVDVAVLHLAGRLRAAVGAVPLQRAVADHHVQEVGCVAVQSRALARRKPQVPHADALVLKQQGSDVCRRAVSVPWASEWQCGMLEWVWECRMRLGIGIPHSAFHIPHIQSVVCTVTAIRSSGGVGPFTSSTFSIESALGSIDK
jgi:hypothetical protein